MTNVITGIDYRGKLATLRHRNGTAVHEGDTVTNFRGKTSKIKGGHPPHKPSGEGFVHTENGAEYYASVFDLIWTHED